MTDKELRRLTRAALIELLILQMEENQKLEKELAALRLQLAGEEFEPAKPKPAAVKSEAAAAPRDGEAKRSERQQKPEPVETPRAAETASEGLTEQDRAILWDVLSERPAKRPQEKKKDPFREALSAFRENNQ